jgi:HPt (histidine-containing phosphotransfer) domain-containing protein
MAEPNRIQDEARLRAIRAALAELRTEYSAALPGVVGELAAAARTAFHNVDDPDLRHVQTLAHRMHGAAGSYGFKAVSASAAKLEELLVLQAKQGQPQGEALRDAVLAAVVDVQDTANRELAELAAPGV